VPEQVAFDAAVRAQADALFRGIADLERLREDDPGRAVQIDRLVEIRAAMNAALGAGGQHEAGNGIRMPVYFDFVDSDVSNARAFIHAQRCYIGIALPSVSKMSRLAGQLAASDAIVAAIGLSTETDREALEGIAYWMLLSFVVSHEYAHHDHGHLTRPTDYGSSVGRLWRQALEADADGWAAYLVLNQWMLADARPVMLAWLSLHQASRESQDRIVILCFFAAYAAFIFGSASHSVHPEEAYWQTHPPSAARLKLMAAWVEKFILDFRPDIRDAVGASYQGLLDSVWLVACSSAETRGGWREASGFLRTPAGAAYYEALVNEINLFRRVALQED